MLPMESPRQSGDRAWTPIHRSNSGGGFARPNRHFDGWCATLHVAASPALRFHFSSGRREAKRDGTARLKLAASRARHGTVTAYVGTDAQCLLASRVRGSDALSSLQMVKDLLKLRLAGLEHEAFAVLHLDSLHRGMEYVETFRGTVSQTSVYPRKGVKDALKLNSSAVILVHNHP